MANGTVAIGIIPARAHSSRFPFKAITPIHGKPMIQWVWESACKASSLKEIWIATDHEEIASVARGFHAKVEMTPSSLPSGTDRVALVARRHHADIVVNLQGDEPLLPAQAIDRLVESLSLYPDVGMATLAVKSRDLAELHNRNVVKAVTGLLGEALYFSREPLRTSEGEFLKHIGIYAYRKAVLERLCALPCGKLEQWERLEQLRALENGISIQVVELSEGTIAVDTPQDVAKVEEVLKKDRIGLK